MPYKKFKDESKLIAKWKLNSKRKPHYFHMFLWEDQESFKKNSLDSTSDDGEVIGCANLAPTFMKVSKDGEEAEFVYPKLGEVHFVKGTWNMEIVAHELMHAMLHRIRGVGSPSFADLHTQDGEEEICYEFGKWVSTIYDLLWEVDPSAKWARVEQAVATGNTGVLSADIR